MKESVPALRKTVADAAGNGLPVPALSASLAYFESYTRGLGTANLIQAQRDFFGAHGFERIGETGAHHGNWQG
jgi:6-phosphogluconate dehydrogenase